MSSNRAELLAAIGAPGSGKSLYIKQTLARRRPRRLLIWDAMNEYGDHAERAELRGLAAAAASPTFAGRFVCSDEPGPRARQFSALCAIAYNAGDCVLVVDELGDVTSATLSLVPVAWSAVCRKGRHRGLVVIGGAQRPALIDKNFFGFATVVHCGRLNFADDVRTMDNVLGLGAAAVYQGVNVPATVRELRPLQWIERNMTSGALSSGVIAVPKKVGARAR